MANKAETLERYHRKKKREKTLTPKPKPCSNPLCTTGWERRPGGWYCTPCHDRLLELAEYHRAKMGKRAIAELADRHRPCTS